MGFLVRDMKSDFKCTSKISKTSLQTRCSLPNAFHEKLQAQNRGIIWNIFSAGEKNPVTEQEDVIWSQRLFKKFPILKAPMQQ